MNQEQLELFDRIFGGLDSAQIFEMLWDWSAKGGCEAACAHCCWVEPDGTCEHGKQSWMRVLGLI